jgi:sulfide dehydrogenase [flavocytochrome c] flavoprotein chain
MNLNRRDFIASSASGVLLGVSGCASVNTGAGPKVVVVGGGYGGATAAKYLRLWSDGKIDVTLVEPNASFISCPMSNLVIGGSQTLADITMSYDNLSKRHGVKLVRDRVSAIDADKKQVRLASGGTLAYDKLVVSPGIDLNFSTIEGLQAAHASGAVLQAWKAGAETVALRKQLEAMPDGGVYAIAIPEAPYRCPPGPYERACQVAHYFKTQKPKSKVLVLDANQDVVSKAGLFKKAWSERYAGMVEYRPQHKAIAVDAKAGLIKFDVQNDVKADVLNVLPEMRAGVIAQQAGLANINKRWAAVNYLTFESAVVKDIHLLGDSIQIAPLMPKSAHMANNHAKVAAAAIVAGFRGEAPIAEPIIANTCYSFVDDKNVVHVASVHKYSAEQKTFLSLQQSQGAGGLSAAANELEGTYAMSWAKNIWADTLA